MHRILLWVAALTAAAPMALRSAGSHVEAQDSTRVEVDTVRAGAGWDSPRVLELMSRAAIRRAQPRADTALHNYHATAEGFVYFFLDRRDTDERTLVRVNQVGIELFWKQPGIARQRIAGMRDASPLPNTMRYHLDHLTMVQNGFGDVIRMGDGDEVKDVVHPASPNAASVYEYRLADSLEVRLLTMPHPIRVYEVQVRPRRTDRPGFVGSVYIDRETADIMRMTFTFTPSSYVDRRLDYINLSLDNGLWEGKYWLPNEQTVEIRRQIPELDFVAGSVIRGRMRITNYDLNTELPDSIFRQGRPVISAPPEQLAAYKFEQGLFDDVTAEGLGQTPETARLRAEAASLIGARLLSGLPALRFYYPDVSSGIRYNRAEGLFLGLGLTRRFGAALRADAAGGYAFASERGSALARIAYAPTSASTSIALTGYAHQLRDLGPITPLAGVANSLSSLFLGRDYLDPWYASGATLRIAKPLYRGIDATVAAYAERQRTATLNSERAPFHHSAEFRPVRPISDGTDLGLEIGLERTAPSSGEIAWGGDLTLRRSFFLTPTTFNEDVFYTRLALDANLTVRNPAHTRIARIDLATAAASSDVPIQQRFYIGGTGTLPGYAYRSFGGDNGALITGELTQRLMYPWLGIRAIGAAGTTTRTIRTSAGAGISLFWDILHIDEIKGLNGGRWVTQITFTRLLDDIS
jgi:hypothetical protein